MIGRRLKEIRIREHYTLENLAHLIDSDARRVSLWENDKASPSAEMLVKLAHVLNISTDYLLGLTADSTPSPTPRKDLTDKEWAVISALRQGNLLEAVRVIVNR